MFSLSATLLPQFKSLESETGKVAGRVKHLFSTHWKADSLCNPLFHPRMVIIYTNALHGWSTFRWCSIVHIIFLVQVRLRTEVLCIPSLPWFEFELMTSRSWQHISFHWDDWSNTRPSVTSSYYSQHT